jgi:hypothetical protein
MNLMPIAAAFGFVFAFLRIIGSVVPPYEERQFMPVLPFLLALAASGGEFLLTATHFPEREGSLNESAAWRFGGRLLVGLLALVVVVTAGVTLESYYFDFVKNVDVKVAEYLNPRVSPGDIVICDHYSVATTLHYYGSDVPDYATRGRSTGEGWEFSEQLALFPDEGIRWTIDLEDVLVHDRIWLVELSWETTGELREVILAETNPVSQTEVGPYVVWLLEPGG